MTRIIHAVKKLLTVVSVMVGLTSYAQIECQIYPGDTTVCYNSYLTMYTNYADTLNYCH